MRIYWRFHLRKLSSRMLLFVVVFNFLFFVGIYRELMSPQPAVYTADVVRTVDTAHVTLGKTVGSHRPLRARPGTYACPELTPHAPTPNTFSFQRVTADGDDTYVFSAFYDHRKRDSAVVRVMGLADNLNDLFCQFSYTDNVLLSVAKAEAIAGGHGRRYEGVVYTCLAPDPDQVPLGVSVTKSHCGKPVNYIPVQAPWTSPTMLDFVVCVTPLNYKFDRYLQLTENIEVNRLFGADKVVFYNYSSGPVVTNYLHRMREFVDVVPWPLPMPVDVWPPVEGHIPQVHYFAQLTALNDCLYRYMFTAKHIVFTDLDEVIVPRPPHNNWSSLLKHLRSKLSSPPATFMFRNVFFWLEWPNDPKYAAIEKVVRLNLTTLLKTRREQDMFPFGSRSKCIVVPRRVIIMGVHEVNEFIDYRQETAFVDASFGLLHHYRVDLGGGVHNPYTIDSRMGDFADQIIERTWRRHQAVLERRR